MFIKIFLRLLQMIFGIYGSFLLPKYSFKFFYFLSLNSIALLLVFRACIFVP